MYLYRSKILRISALSVRPLTRLAQIVMLRVSIYLMWLRTSPLSCYSQINLLQRRSSVARWFAMTNFTRDTTSQKVNIYVKALISVLHWRKRCWNIGVKPMHNPKCSNLMDSFFLALDHCPEDKMIDFLEDGDRTVILYCGWASTNWSGRPASVEKFFIMWYQGTSYDRRVKLTERHCIGSGI